MMDKNYKVYIFDVDGTLYSQKKMHVLMLVSLLKYYIVHPLYSSEVLYLFNFRKQRERDTNKGKSVEELCRYLAKGDNIKTKKMYDVIDKWMFTFPLDLLPMCEYEPLIKYIKDIQDRVLIYSDYPAEEKLIKLGINPKWIVTSEDEIEGAELKPSIAMMAYIMKLIGEKPSDILYVGDRDEKDKASAKLVGVDYCDIKEFLKCI